MNRTRHLLALAAIGLAAGPSAFAQQPQAADHDQHHASTATGSVVPSDMAEGEVRKVDREAGKVTLRHGPIKNLDMPPMTMVFRATDPRLLDKVKVGDKVRFAAGKEGSAIVVNAIEPAP